MTKSSKSKKIKKSKKSKKVKKVSKPKKIKKVKKVKRIKKVSAPKKLKKKKAISKKGKSIKGKKSVKKKPAAKKAKVLKKSPFNKKDLAAYKSKLSEIRDKITGDVNRLEENALMNTRDASGDLSGYGLHMADVATDNYDQELNLGLASTEQNLLNRIENALKRIEEGTFGLSIKSGKLITKKRLNVVPYAELTIEEQEEEEKNKFKGV